MNTALKLLKSAKFDIGDNVDYANKHGKDYGVVTGISIRQGCVMYAVTWSNKEERYHYDFELSIKASN